jgi:hypothetical protein
MGRQLNQQDFTNALVNDLESGIKSLRLQDRLTAPSYLPLKSCNHDHNECRRILTGMGLEGEVIEACLSYLPLQCGGCDCEVFWNVDMTNPKPMMECSAPGRTDRTPVKTASAGRNMTAHLVLGSHLS